VILAVSWATLCFGAIIPRFSEGRGYRHLGRWPSLPDLLGRPIGSWAHFESGTEIRTVITFLAHLFLPLGFAPLFGPATLAIAAPSLGYLLLSEHPYLHTVSFHYPAILVPWLFLATARGLGRIRKSYGDREGLNLYWVAIVWILVGAGVIHYKLDPVALYAAQGLFQRDPARPQVMEALREIPEDAGVATINRFGPHLANHRYHVVLESAQPLYWPHLDAAEYVLLDITGCRASSPRDLYAELIVQILQTGDFAVAYQEGPILLLRRSPGGNEYPELIGQVRALAEEDDLCSR
jgi:uncharacterized membrane protein